MTKNKPKKLKVEDLSQDQEAFMFSYAYTFGASRIRENREPAKFTVMHKQKNWFTGRYKDGSIFSSTYAYATMGECQEAYENAIVKHIVDTTIQYPECTAVDAAYKKLRKNHTLKAELKAFMKEHRALKKKYFGKYE